MGHVKKDKTISEEIFLPIFNPKHVGRKTTISEEIFPQILKKKTQNNHVGRKNFPSTKQDEQKRHGHLKKKKLFSTKQDDTVVTQKETKKKHLIQKFNPKFKKFLLYVTYLILPPLIQLK